MLDLVNGNKFSGNEARSQFITLRNDQLQVQISNYGARVVSLFTKDRAGNFDDIVLGCDFVADYYSGQGIYMGATIGRYANRIGGSIFNIGEKNYFLDSNDGVNHLHGGAKGFHTVWWELIEHSATECRMKYTSVDGDQGYPGTLSVEIKYGLKSQGLEISYKGTTSHTTYVNLCNHSYFNLKGAGNGDILSHELSLDADFYLLVDEGLIPIGKLEPVIGSPFDFKVKSPIGNHIRSNNNQLDGYDNTWVLNNPSLLKSVARVEESKSGRTLEVLTTEPAVHFYTAKISCKGKSGVMYNDHSAFCLETQHFSNSPNEPSFPSTLLHPEEEYSSTTLYRFGTI